LVVAGEKAVEEFLEIPLRPLHTVRQPLLAENAKEAFDEIQPGAMGRSVVKANLGMAAQPLAGSVILMNVQVIDYDM
jgi:hypothetical protein